MREGGGRRGSSSSRMRRSSSEEREIRESRSWPGSWYLRVKGARTERAEDTAAVKEESVPAEAVGMEMMRVSPPE